MYVVGVVEYIDCNLPIQVPLGSDGWKSIDMYMKAVLDYYSI